jgi:hypothetical protein
MGYLEMIIKPAQLTFSKSVIEVLMFFYNRRNSASRVVSRSSR